MRIIVRLLAKNICLLVAIQVTLISLPAQAKDPALLPAPHFRELTIAERPAIQGLADRPCFDTEFGWIFCRSEAEAKDLAEDVRAAATTFLRYFGAVPGRGAVVTIGTSSLVPFEELEKAGAEWFMPWLDSQSLNEELKKQAVGQAREQLEKLGLKGELLDKALADVARQLAGPGTQGKHPLRHELGHIWFIRMFWGAKALRNLPGAADQATHYGGPAHDWLDETAAVLMENDELTADRRREFAAAFKASPERIRPLAEFFTMEHPGTKAIASNRQKNAPQAAPGASNVNIEVNFIADEKGKAATTAQADFYSECRGFSDFLLQRTKDDRVFQQIAVAEASGGSVATWLSANGRRYGLPATVEELDKQFRTWAAERGS